MKLKILTPDNNEKGEIALPKQFSETVRKDLIKRAVDSLRSRRRQPYGAMPRAGAGHSTKLSFRRRNYKGLYGHGMSRVPRKTMSRNGTQMNWTGALAPMTVGGRRAHPPKSERVLARNINIQENRKAIRSALSAVVDKSLVVTRGHKVPDAYPFAVSADFESISKSKDAIKSLNALGLKNELSRCSQTKIRAGKGKLRGRKKVGRKGPLLVVAGPCALTKAADNIPGVDVCTIKQLNAEILAPGAEPGRLTLLTEGAIQALSKEELFI